MTTWSEIATDLESRLAEAESLLAAGGEPDSTLFDAPPGLPPGVPDAAEQVRLEAILRRIAAVQGQVRRELTRIGGELAGSKRERSAARAYSGQPRS